MCEEALDIVRVMVTNGAKQDADVALTAIIAWCDEAGFDEQTCLQGLAKAAGARWIVGVSEFAIIRLTSVGLVAVRRSTH